VPHAWTVSAEEAGLRLDKYLASEARLGSRAKATSALERGKILLNGEEASPVDASRRLAAGDLVRAWMDRPGTSKPRPRAQTVGDLQILYEDDDLLVVNKPAGLLAVPLERRAEAPSVYDQLADHFRGR